MGGGASGCGTLGQVDIVRQAVQVVRVPRGLGALVWHFHVWRIRERVFKNDSMPDPNVLIWLSIIVAICLVYFLDDIFPFCYPAKHSVFAVLQAQDKGGAQGKKRH